jgi:hypothetical protein
MFNCFLLVSNPGKSFSNNQEQFILYFEVAHRYFNFKLARNKLRDRECPESMWTLAVSNCLE